MRTSSPLELKVPSRCVRVKVSVPFFELRLLILLQRRQVRTVICGYGGNRGPGGSRRLNPALAHSLTPLFDPGKFWAPAPGWVLGIWEEWGGLLPQGGGAALGGLAQRGSGVTAPRQASVSHLSNVLYPLLVLMG